MSHSVYCKLPPCLILLVSLALTGCTAGPEFQPPAPPQTRTYTAAPLPEQTTRIASAGAAGKAQHFIAGQTIPAAWWDLYHSAALNELVIAGLAHSPTLAAAKATLRQAQENLNAQIGTLLFPSLNGQLSAQRQNYSSAALGGGVPSNLFNLYNATVNVAYTLDIFGSSRRQIEAVRAQVDYEYYELHAAYLTLTANIVTTAITAASLQAQITATRQLIQAEANQLNIMQQQWALGSLSKENILLQQTQLAQTRALLPPLERSLSQSKNALAVLAGSLPSENPLPSIDLNTLVLPTQLPISLPSALVQQRPDVQAAVALLHQASAQVGLATAHLFPQITLSGNYGWSAAIPSTLFQPMTNTWSLGSQLLQPIFNGSALRAQRRAALAVYAQAQEQYRQIVLQAFQNVADSLRALETDARELKEQKRAEITAYAALKLIKTQFSLGGASYLAILTAEQQYQQARINCIQAQAARYLDTAALFQALGGGWWNNTEGGKR